MFGDWRHQTGYVSSFGKHTETLYTISIGEQDQGMSAAPKSIQTYELYHTFTAKCNEKI